MFFEEEAAEDYAGEVDVGEWEAENAILEKGSSLDSDDKTLVDDQGDDADLGSNDGFVV
jgi:hypothetical protein